MESLVLEEQISKIKKRNQLHDKVNVTKEKPTIEKGSIQEISDLISSKESAIKNLRVGSDSFNLLRDEIEKLKADKELLEIQLNPKVDENSMNSLLGSLQKVQEQINGLKTSISVTTDKTELDSLSEQLKFLTDKEHKIQLSIDEKRQSAIAQNVDEIKTQYEGLGQAAQSVGNVFSSLGNVTNDSFMQMIGSISGAVSSILPEIGKLVAANQAAAISSGTASAAAMPFPANLISIATIVSSILGVFSSLPKFADGGIVQGKKFGDYNLARVNGGEMILNSTQQGRLWNTIQQGQSTSSAPMNGNVTFRIEGKQLVGVLNNYNSSKSRL